MVDNQLLYFVEVDGIGRLLALDVTLNEESGNTQLTFFDTNRGRIFYGEIIEQSASGFTFRSEHGQIKRFRVATVKEFNHEWRNIWVEGSLPAFQTDSELHAWYRKTFLELG